MTMRAIRPSRLPCPVFEWPIAPDAASRIGDFLLGRDGGARECAITAPIRQTDKTRSCQPLDGRASNARIVGSEQMMHFPKVDESRPCAEPVREKHQGETMNGLQGPGSPSPCAQYIVSGGKIGCRTYGHGDDLRSAVGTLAAARRSSHTAGIDAQNITALPSATPRIRRAAPSSARPRRHRR